MSQAYLTMRQMTMSYVHPGKELKRDAVEKRGKLSAVEALKAATEPTAITNSPFRWVVWLCSASWKMVFVPNCRNSAPICTEVPGTSLTAIKADLWGALRDHDLA